MNPFRTDREAKEFLISRIVEEAQRENVVLSETERKMLYFSETGSTLSDMAKVSEDFDSAYDQGDYERKIAPLIRNAGKNIRKQSTADYDAWWEAIQRLKRGDHYLLVMIRQAGLRPRGDLAKLCGTGTAIVVLLVALTFLSSKYGIDLGKYIGRGGPLGPYIWVAMLAAVITYQVFRFVLGAKRIDDWLFKLVDKVIRLRAKKV